MDKRKLSKIPRISATKEMCETAERLSGIEHIVTAELIEGDEILQMTCYKVKDLRAGKLDGDFRTFLSKDDYISQDLKTVKTKWMTASFERMERFSPIVDEWNREEHRIIWRTNVFINSKKDLKVINRFFKKYHKDDDNNKPWDAIYRFQESVRNTRLLKKHKKVTDVIDERMKPVQEPPKQFYEWVWEKGMSFSRYLIYKEIKKGKAECECTHCGNVGIVDRKEVRLRNNEKGKCPFCGSRITIKAKGRLPYQTEDARWFLYVDPTEDGFLLRYYRAVRSIKNNSCIESAIDKNRVEEWIHEYSRAFYKFEGDKPIVETYEWGVYKQRGTCRWCPDMENIDCKKCILYPDNLPEAWSNTPMKYSALEVMSENIPTVSLRYEDAMKTYLKFPKLEWLCKMGLNNLVKDIIYDRDYIGRLVGKVNYEGKTIFNILGLTKVNTRILQELDGDNYVLRLLQVSQKIGMQFKSEQLREYYETFGCNTELLEQANRKVSLHKLVKYITKESEKYCLGEKSGCWKYSCMRYKEREDPRIERKQNMARDWLEYLKWCKELGYDLNNMFFYMPTNFRKVHDRTYKEYQELQDKLEVIERKRQEREAAKRMKKIKTAMEDIFKKNAGVDAFSIKGNGLLLVVPTSADEIRAEGAALHHCVGTYVDQIARGETKIFFIRKVAEPDRPYFTMEWKNNRIIQCRGIHNCGMPPEVEAFIKVFEKKMLDTLNKKKEIRRCS